MLTIYEIRHRSANGVKLYGGARDFWKYKGHEVILSGPFETGKTFAVLHKLHALCCKYPGAQALMVRNTYESLRTSAVVTLDTKILPQGIPDADKPVRKYGGERPEFFLYYNGSRIVLGGLDKPDKFLSSEWDYIYVNQAEELALDAWEKLCARATGRAGHVPYPQVMADCNPSYPAHWIQRRRKNGALHFLEQFHKDNPILYDPQTQTLTAQGELTMAALNRLTGVRRDRGLLNLWVSAEGVIYDNLSLTANITPDADYTPDRPVYWGVDDGYAHGEGIGSQGHHPRVILFGQLQANGGMHVFDEYYQTLQLPEKTIDDCLARPYQRPMLALVDSSAAELRRRLSEKNIPNGPASHKVADGIKIVRRFICNGDGVRLLKIHPRCDNLIRELQSYRYNPNTSVAEAGEPTPLKMDDHACDALRYLLWNFK
jgi:phage terminase large subunit